VLALIFVVLFVEKPWKRLWWWNTASEVVARQRYRLCDAWYEQMFWKCTDSKATCQP